MSEDILGIKINKDLQWFKMTLANGEEIDLVKKQDYIKLQNNWNKLKKGLRLLLEFDEGVVSKDYLECAEDTLEKMEELENSNNE